METQKRRRFPESLKRQAVERVLDGGSPIVRVAEELGLHETLLRRWMTRFSEAGPTPRSVTQTPSPADLAAKTEPSERHRPERRWRRRLKRELTQAQRERDMLKKAALIFGAAGR